MMSREPKTPRGRRDDGWEPVDIYPDFEEILSEETVIGIANAGCVHVDTAPRDRTLLRDRLRDLRSDLIEAAASYWPLRHARRRPSDMEDREQLEALGQLAQQLVGTISGLSPSALDRLYKTGNLHMKEKALFSLEVSAAQIASWAAHAAPSGGKRGAVPDHHKARAVRLLADIYRKHAGREPGRDAAGPFARFVRAFFDMVDPEQQVSGSSLRKYLADTLQN